MENKKNYTSPYDLDGKIPFGQALALGLQHVLAMFVGNLTPIWSTGFRSPSSRMPCS